MRHENSSHNVELLPLEKIYGLTIAGIQCQLPVFVSLSASRNGCKRNPFRLQSPISVMYRFVTIINTDPWMPVVQLETQILTVHLPIHGIDCAVQPDLPWKMPPGAQWCAYTEKTEILAVRFQENYTILEGKFCPQFPDSTILSYKFNFSPSVLFSV